MFNRNGFGGLDTDVCWDIYKLVAPYIPERKEEEEEERTKEE